MGRVTGRRLGVAVVLLAVALGVLWGGRLASHNGLDWAAKVSEVASFVLALGGVLVAPFGKLAQWLRGPQQPTLEQLASARDRLESALAAAWSEEGTEVYDDLPMRVRFGPWSDGIPQAPLGVSGAAMSATNLSASGEFDSVVEVFAREPRFRRVVLGESGSGKTVLVAELQRKLLEVPRAGDPLPVTVRAAAWRPDKQSLLDWLARQLAADFAWLPATHARALVVSGKVLPIIDGLDEMPVSLQPGAIARINEHLVFRPMVVTSRVDEYRDAVRDNRAGIKGAAVVVIQPLLAADIRAYLDPAGSGQWAEALAELDDDAESPLAGLLANPLMLWLARLVYQDRNPRPLTRFASRASLEGHLLREFVPAIYGSEPSWPPLHQFRCAEWQARRWLGCLASGSRKKRAPGSQRRRADDRGTPGLSWWQIGALAGGWRVLGICLRAAALLSTGTALAVWVLARSGNWRNGIYSGPLNFGKLFLGGRVGQLIQPTARQLTAPVARVLGLQAVVTGTFHFIEHVLARPLLVAGTVTGIVALAILMNYIAVPRDPVRLQIRPGRALVRALTSCTSRFVVAALGAFLLIHFQSHQPRSTNEFFGAHATWIALLAISLTGLTWIPLSFIKESDLSGNLNPAESLGLDRQADMVVTVTMRAAFAAVLWLFCGQLLATAYGLYAITATLMTLILGGRGRASREYTDARIWLAARRRLPWRTMAFLADARRRGVLRQVGAAYQFRHARLREQAGEWRLARGPGLVRAFRRRFRHVWDLVVVKYFNDVRPTSDDLRDEAARYRQVARTHPRSRPGLAEDLGQLAERLRRRSGAATLTTARTLLDAHRALAETDPAAFRPRLAQALSLLAGIFPPYEALQLREEAVDLYRDLAEADPPGFLPSLATAGHALAGHLTQMGKAEEALGTARDLADTYRRLAQTAPSALLPVLAESLHDLAERAWVLRPEESLSAQTEAVAIYRRLADDDPARFAARLTSFLDALASSLRQLGRQEEELLTVRDAIDSYLKRAERIAAIRRQIGAAELAAILPVREGLGQSGTRSLGRTKREEEEAALAAAWRAADALAGRADSAPPEYMPDLAEAARGLAP
jgi:tetratricopeptide (TPR) repeat protein